MGERKKALIKRLASIIKRQRPKNLFTGVSFQWIENNGEIFLTA
jgi:hypothetical protein